MNILIDSLPCAMWIGDAEYKLRTDFRVWIMFELLMQDRLLTQNERVAAALQLCYEQVPRDMAAMKDAVDGLLWFYSCGKVPKAQPETDGGGENKAIYSFEQDDDYIYAAFLAQYGIDLQDADLHWWKFKAMFKGLKEDNQIIKIMGFRAMVIDNNMSDTQKQYYIKMKELYALDDGRSEAEKERDFELDLLGGL